MMTTNDTQRETTNRKRQLRAFIPPAHQCNSLRGYSGELGDSF